MVHKKTFGSKQGPVCNTNRSQLSIWQKYDSRKLLISKGEGKNTLGLTTEKKATEESRNPWRKQYFPSLVLRNSAQAGNDKSITLIQGHRSLFFTFIAIVQQIMHTALLCLSLTCKLNRLSNWLCHSILLGTEGFIRIQDKLKKIVWKNSNKWGSPNVENVVY